MHEAEIEIVSNAQMKWTQVVLFRKMNKRKLLGRWIKAENEVLVIMKDSLLNVYAF